MFEWDKLVDNFSKYHFTILITFIIELTALVIVIIYGRKSKIGRAFIFYISLDFCFLIIDQILKSHPGVPKKFYLSFLNNSNTLISLVEMLVYSYFFSSVLQRNKMKVLIKILSLLFTLIVIIYFISGFSFLTSRIGYVSDIVGVVEFIFLLPFCLFYFYTLLNNNSEIKLFDRPSFWIVTGIFFYSFISIPFYLINKYLSNNYAIIWVNTAPTLYYLPFAFNFVFLIKAFLCKRALTI